MKDCQEKNIKNTFFVKYLHFSLIFQKKNVILRMVEFA